MKICYLVASALAPNRLEKMVKSWYDSKCRWDLCIYAQGYDADFIRKLEKYRDGAVGFLVIESVPLYPVPICLLQIRDDARKWIENDYEYYVYCDDDFVFKDTSEPWYQKALDHLEGAPQCGAVQCNGYLAGHLTKDQVVPMLINKYYSTSRGIVTRMHPSLMTVNPRPMLLVDSCIAHHWISQGMYYAEIRNTPTHKPSDGTRHNRVMYRKEEAEGLSAMYERMEGRERPIPTPTTPEVANTYNMISEWYGFKIVPTKLPSYAMINTYRELAEKRFGGIPSNVYEYLSKKGYLK